MTIGELKQQIASLEDDLDIEVDARYLNELDFHFDLLTVEKRMDPDTAKEYARFGCSIVRPEWRTDPPQ